MANPRDLAETAERKRGKAPLKAKPIGRGSRGPQKAPGLKWATDAQEKAKVARVHSLVQQCLRVAIAQCGPVPGLPRFRHPPEKIPSRSLFATCNDEIDFDFEDEYPWGLPSRNLIAMAWNGLLGSSTSFSALRLDRRTWLYFEFPDCEADSLYFLAVVKTDAPYEAHKRFLREIFRSNGRTFGAEFLVSPPEEIVSRFARSFLNECFVLGSKVAYSDDFWGEVRDIIAQHEPDSSVLSVADAHTTSGQALLAAAYLAATVR